MHPCAASPTQLLSLPLCLSPCIQVFRTYNASITLDRLLAEKEENSEAVTVDEKKADYDLCNKEVAILCNHQRSASKQHGAQVRA